MLYKTILELNKDLSKEERIDNICNNLDDALEEIKNYQIAYIKNVSLKEKEQGLEEIINSLDQLKNFIKESTKW